VKHVSIKKPRIGSRGGLNVLLIYFLFVSIGIREAFKAKKKTTTKLMIAALNVFTTE